jgi:hypothetical protein
MVMPIFSGEMSSLPTPATAVSRLRSRRVSKLKCNAKVDPAILAVATWLYAALGSDSTVGGYPLSTDRQISVPIDRDRNSAHPRLSEAKGGVCISIVSIVCGCDGDLPDPARNVCHTNCRPDLVATGRSRRRLSY